MTYRIQGTITVLEGRFATDYSFPTFYLDSQIQGIRDVSHAREIAKEVVDPANLAQSVHLQVEEVDHEP